MNKRNFGGIAITVQKMRSAETQNLVAGAVRRVFIFGEKEDEMRARFGLMNLSWQEEKNILAHRSKQQEFLRNWEDYAAYCRRKHPQYWNLGINELLGPINEIYKERTEAERFGEELSEGKKRRYDELNEVLICKRIRGDVCDGKR